MPPRQTRKQSQLVFTSVLEDSFKSHERRLIKYMADNVEIYKASAWAITPHIDDTEAIFGRVAFAILSANAPFADSVKALGYVLKHKGKVHDKALIAYRMIPAKVKYCNQLWYACRSDPSHILRQGEESWHEYRIRLMDTIAGLGLTKASFAAGMLYPNEADVACVDTWIQKVFLNNNGFKEIGLAKYLEVESYIRRYAIKFGCSTFLAQWMTWDHVRRKVTNHDIFPGAHE